jgi:hypothetical protein
MPTKLTSKQLSQRLSKRLASYGIKDEVITELAARAIIDGFDIKKFDICPYGICFDYFSDRVPKLDGILSGPDVVRIDVFPYGIIDWDRFHVRVGYSVEGLDGRGSIPGH